MNIFSIGLISLFFSISSTLPNISLAQTKAPDNNTAPSGETNQLPFDMTSSWRMKVSRDDGAQALQIPEETKRDNTKKFFLNAISSFTKGELVKISAEMIETDQYRILLLTPATGNKIIAIQNQDGNFEGTLTTTKGQILGVKIQKLTEKEIGEIVANSTASRTQSAIKLPMADVPASCAGFIGGWTGRWPRYGQTWLWVVEIDAQCSATYAHRGGAGFPKASVFKKAEILKGELSCPDNQGGIDSFELHGNELWARHSGSDGNNTTVFQKISLEAK